MDNSVFKTKEQVEKEGLLSVAPYSIYSKANLALHKESIDKLQLFHSDVYFVRYAMWKRSGYWLPLDRVEKAMIAEGWKRK